MDYVPAPELWWQARKIFFGLKATLLASNMAGFSMDDEQEQVQQAQPTTALSGILFAVAVAALTSAAIEWTNYQFEGKSLLFGVNSRCLRYEFGHCFELDTSNLPLEAVVTSWLVWALAIAAAVGTAGLYVVAPAGLVARVIVFPSDRNAPVLARLADSGHWLQIGAFGFGGLVAAGVWFAIYIWTDWPFVSIMGLGICQVVIGVAAERAESWAQNHRRARADAHWAKVMASYKELDEDETI